MIKCSAMPCALHCYFSCTYSSFNHTLIFDVIAFVKNKKVSVEAVPWDAVTQTSSCQKSQPWQPKEILVVSTVGAGQHKKDDYVPWY